MPRENYEFVERDKPPNGGLWVKTCVHIRKNDTGEIRIYEDRYGIIGDDEDEVFVGSWEDGNDSCDCNRLRYWLWANNEEEPYEIECGDGKFSVNIYDCKGNLIYKEFDETPNAE